MENRRYLRILFIVTGFTLMNYSIFVIHPLLDNPNAWGIIKSNLYITFGKIGFVIGLGFLLASCIISPDNLLRRFLSNKLFMVLSKLSYSIYLTHPFILSWFIYTSPNTLSFSTGNLLLYTIKDLIWIFLFSLMFYLIIECPL